MSDPSSSGADKTGSPKKRISPARNLIGLIVLVAVVAVGWFQYSALSRYNAAVNGVNERTADETKALMSIDEAESMVGIGPDDVVSESSDGRQTFTKKTYTWRGPLKSYTLTAFYTKGPGAGLHHFETDEKKFTPAPITVDEGPTSGIAPSPVPPKKAAQPKEATPAAQPTPAPQPKEAAPAAQPTPAPQPKEAAPAAQPTPAPEAPKTSP